MTTSPLFSDLELQARQILATVDRSTVSGEAIAAINVFKARYSAALSALDASRIAAALYTEGKPWDIQSGLTALVRAKVLRTRRISGTQYYEINFPK